MIVFLNRGLETIFPGLDQFSNIVLLLYLDILNWLYIGGFLKEINFFWSETKLRQNLHYQTFLVIWIKKHRLMVINGICFTRTVTQINCLQSRLEAHKVENHWYTWKRFDNVFHWNEFKLSWIFFWLEIPSISNSFSLTMKIENLIHCF